MQLIEQKIKQTLVASTIPQLLIEPISTEVWTKKAKQMLYPGLLLFGVFENLVNSYFFGATLFALIPRMTDPTLIIMSLTYAFLDSVLFYLYQASVLREALDIPSSSKISRLIDVYAEQLGTMHIMNRLLSSLAVLTLPHEQYADYIRFARLANDDLRMKYHTISAMKEPWYKELFKAGVFVFGMISSLAGSYFVAMTFLTLLAAPLVGTPIGWLIIVATMLLGLGFHYAMDASGMTRVVNRDYLNYQDLKKKFGLFYETYPDDLNMAQTLRNTFEKKPTQDASTQTEAFEQEESVICYGF
jgi:hypothetical protein